jgi:basic amino acid/polyamine antiporter, APA family
MDHPQATPALKRALGLPLLVFYGLGVTVGAGIFALVGKIVGIAGDFAPLAFLIAGIVATATARAYAILARRYPKAGGAAVYAHASFGGFVGRIIGVGVAVTGVISSGVIVLAFSGYVGTLISTPGPILTVGLLVVLAGIATLGVKESIVFAAGITILEVGTLVVIAVVGFPSLADGDVVGRLIALPADRATLDLTIAAAAVAFFAFIGFEDIVNMAEEAKTPERSMGPAIAITLALTTALYVLIAAIAAASPNSEAIAGSDAPLADLFAGLTGLPPAPISVVAAIAMVNGILVQIVMASRVLYGMATDGMLPAWLGKIAPRRQTPIRATLLVTAAIAALALTAPMVTLAQARATSLSASSRSSISASSTWQGAKTGRAAAGFAGGGRLARS